MALKNLETKWSAYLSGDKCPPVLGLVALTEEESEIIGQLVAAEIRRGSRPQLQTLFSLLYEFPACLAVWVARKAGEAYEAGAFWDEFGELIGVSIPMNQREEFAQRYRLACRKTMTMWMPLQEPGAHRIVAEFLHQAGLPLDRCDGFAQHVRRVERSFGLPDADAPDAGEQLRDAVLDSLQPYAVPTLKRALRGPAGSRICEVALDVVLKGDFSGINPRLGQELERVFEHAGRGLRRSAHQPYVRLGEDLGSLEIVGPRQDASLVGAGGLTWVVDGRRYPTSRTEEFVLPVTDRPRVVLELTGLLLGALPPRIFVLRIDDLTEPFILFDERTRRQRRASRSLPAGLYWLLHRTTDEVITAEQRYEWPDGARVLSLIRVRPEAEAVLRGGHGGPWSFVATLAPFFDPVGQRLTHEAGAPVCFGWQEMPPVWVPIEEADSERLARWRVRLSDSDIEHTWALSRTEDAAGGMVRCLIESGDFLATLPPGMHRFELALSRAERGRTEAQAEYWLWQGLRGQDANGFYLDAPAENLLPSGCRGFSLGKTFIRHLADQHRRHTLAFGVGGGQVDFHWPQPGVFVESLERRAGEQAQPRPHHLGEPFSASLNSARWIRIWLAGQFNWEVVVAGQTWQRYVGGDRREFVELSLASLAAAFPQGGDIRVKLDGGDLVVARFSSPLQPVAVDRLDDQTYRGFQFHFSEPVNWIRPMLRELASGQRRALDGQQFGTSGRCAFTAPDLPTLECSNVADGTALNTSSGHPVTLSVPKEGWPKGFWLIELEVRRDEQAEWEPVALHGHEVAPLVVLAYNNQPLATTRERLFWQSWNAEQAQSPDFPLELDDNGCTELFELLADFIELRKRDMVHDARLGVPQLKDALRSLSRLAGRIARRVDSSGLQTKLLNLACQDSSHAGFVHLPGLLALPAGEYSELPAADPLNDALRRCGRLAAADSVVEVVHQDPSFVDLDVLSCFANFAQVAAASKGDPSATEFNGFDHEKYWRNVLGKPRRDRLATDWSGEGALGRAHFEWALARMVGRYELVGRYEHETHELNLGAANVLLYWAPQFRAWLRQHLGEKAGLSAAAWNAPWPQFAAADVDFLEAAPRFASLFALAARAASAGLLEIDETLTWLERRVEHRWMAEEAIAVLVGLAPELFGHQLLFWELMIRTRTTRVGEAAR
jgi:hypothetical protein